MDSESAVLDRPDTAEDDGLGETPVVDPNSEEATGIPGGRQPGDDGYVEDGAEPAGEPEQPDPEEPVAADLPDDGAGDPVQEEFALELPGNREIGLKVAGRKPDSSVLKFKGGVVSLSGQFDRGDRFPTVDTWQVTGDNDQDTIDRLSGDVKSTSKAQNATLCGTTRLEEYLVEKLPRELAEQVAKHLDLELPEGE